MIDVRVEQYATVIGEIKPLLELHWQEIATDRDAIPLDPNFEQYRAMEAAGNLVILTAREAGALIGYSIFFLIRHPHYQSTVFAMNDILFVTPAKRGGRAGLRLIRESERVMRERGASKISWHIKAMHDFSPLLHRIGYATEEIILAKLLKE